MKNLPQPIRNYVNRFLNQYIALGISEINDEDIEAIILTNSTQLNNLFMSGLGASTLILRLAAVVNLSKKLNENIIDDDALLLKQILENLREILPTDTNWKNIWQICCDPEIEWNKFVLSKKGKKSLIERFITFRNKYVHELISINIPHKNALLNGLEIIYVICSQLSNLFNNTEFKIIDGKFHFIEGNKEINLFPFIQKGNQDGLPYIFQGLYKNKSSVELINAFNGDIQKLNESKQYDKLFDPMLNLLKGGAGQVFDHLNKLDNFADCFVGREKESNQIYEWASSSIDNNILSVYSQAGMGKSALIGDVISKLFDENIPVLYHFCGSGLANNLHAILYHLILQGKKNQLWQNIEEELKNKKLKLPSKYSDVIMFMHKLIDNHFFPTRKNVSGNLVIIIDGLDEAFVSFPSYHISDYFFNYDENGKVLNNWNSDSNIKWIFTYREGFYELPTFNNLHEIESVQPLLGLDEDSIYSALKLFKPSKEFIDTIMEKGKVSQ
jgi:hypothetical protein